MNNKMGSYGLGRKAKLDCSLLSRVDVTSLD